VHLEDNEEALLEASMELPFSELKRLPLSHLDKIIPPHLSHPIRYRDFLQGAVGVSMLIDSLRQFIPDALPSVEIWPGYEDEMNWAPRPDHDLREKLGIKLGSMFWCIRATSIRPIGARSPAYTWPWAC
jgi:hypothetical protein